jgi:hypothetical protein
VYFDLGFCPTVGGNDQWIGPIAGVRTIWQLPPRWSFTANGDVDGFEVGSGFSWLENGLVGYRSSIFGESDSKFFGW